jgi:hypothetical protein
MKKPRGDEYQRAQKLYAEFTGLAPHVVGTVAAPRAGKYGVLVGTVDFIGYTTRRKEGASAQTQKFIHKFRAADRPLFVVSADGAQLFMVGGRFRFTERGIVDASDRSG